jgi:hypothetical protein
MCDRKALEKMFGLWLPLPRHIPGEPESHLVPIPEFSYCPSDGSWLTVEA